MHQYNGEYGCPYCMAPGECNGRGSSRYYSCQESFPDRTHDEIVRDGIQAHENSTCTNGVYGPTILSCIPDFDLSVDVGAEYMHGCAGTMKTMLGIWFDSSQHDSEWYLKPYIHDIDKKSLNHDHCINNG
eukprot:Pompholyxophrys_sp_v1_NODE_298_length_816_cov_9.239159.p1 type:complete len:130 gc:universal NODE_298_length_816_cov_9.239159:492-103(-)